MGINIIDAFNTKARYLVDFLNINNIHFSNMVSQIYPSELHPNKANTWDTKLRNGAKVRNRYNQVPHLTQDTICEIDKNTIKHQKRHVNA